MAKRSRQPLSRQLTFYYGFKFPMGSCYFSIGREAVDAAAALVELQQEFACGRRVDGDGGFEILFSQEFLKSMSVDHLTVRELPNGDFEVRKPGGLWRYSQPGDDW